MATKSQLLLWTAIFMVTLPGSAKGEFFSDKPIWSSGTSNSGGDGVARFIDFDRDGDMDFLTSLPNPMRWALYRNQDGNLSKKPVWESNGTTDCDHIDVIDFNRDGWPDLAGTHESHCTLYFNRRGRFEANPDWETDIIANANQIDFGDFDQDGDYDMLMAAGEPIMGVALFENKAGTPAKKPTLKLGYREYSEVAIFADFDADGDLDNDGDEDLIAADYSDGGSVILFLNDGGKLSDEPAWSVKTTGAVHEAVLADIDLDGDLDLAAGGRDQAYIYENLTITSGHFTAANRARRMINAQFVFRPCVFSGDDFPPCDFVNPDQARRWLGDYQIDVTFYYQNYEVVEKAEAAGRYGAVVKITAQDGRKYTRFRTLFKSPERLSMFGQLDGELAFPESTGVHKETWQNQRELANAYVSRAVGRDIHRSHDFAVLLAGMAEMNPKQGPVSRLESAVTRDRKWWLKLKRKLNGNAERFSEPIVAPVDVDELDARVLREGTEEEAGMKPGTVKNIDAVLTEWAENSDEPFNACVARNGVVFFHRAYGSRDGKPITTETKHVVYSISKALSGSLLMTFVDRGIVSLDDPVAKVLPEFQDTGVETPVTFHHLFTHTADMDGHFTDPWNDLEHVYGEAYPYLRIGKQLRYNGTSIGVGLKALEQLTGLTLPELYQEHLFGPLGCESIESIDGSAMTWSNAKDLARVGQMLANHGSYGNLRFFREETFGQMLPRKLDNLLGPDTNVTWGVGLTWFRGNGLSERTIGHGSASSCTLRVDLEQNLVITMTRRTAGKHFEKYHPRFIKAVTSGVSESSASGR